MCSLRGPVRSIEGGFHAASADTQMGPLPLDGASGFEGGTGEPEFSARAILGKGDLGRLRHRLALILMILNSLSFVLRVSADPGSVYIVMGSDTAVWNAPGGIAVANFRNHFDPALFTSPETNAFKSIDPLFRSQFVDSYAQPLKMTWWLLVGSVYGQCDNLNVPVPNLMPLYLMRKYHGEVLSELGDEVTLHYHTFTWSDYNGDGLFFWNEARTFHECRSDWDLALAQSLVEEGVFPVSFRSGWHYMDNEWQQYLNELLPYNMDNDSPNRKAWSTNEPAFNVLDWSQASTEFIPFQPSATNYQVAGTGTGWNVRSVKFANVTASMIARTFDEAAAGVDQVVSLWGHLAESDFVPNIAKMHNLIQAAADSHPEVAFRYCTAVEAMQRWRRVTNESPPVISITQQIEGDSLTLNLSSSKALFQAQPFVAVKDVSQRYTIEPCVAAGSNSWRAQISVPRSKIAKIRIVATDSAGNLSTEEARFVPDDLYLDNLDPEYLETEGNWTTSAVAAWGIDSRVAVLASNEFARVSWTLPVTDPRPYSILAQFPDVAKLSTNVEFILKAGDLPIFTNRMENGFAPKTWLYVGTALLDPAASNSLEVTMHGNGRTESVAAADVVRVTPLNVPAPDFITGVIVDAGDTTANISWTTAKPAVAHVRYGLDASLGRFSPTNDVPTTKHLATLTGLAPGKRYHAQINAGTEGVNSTYEATFKLQTNAPPLKLSIVNNAGTLTIFWNGTSNRLQRAETLQGAATEWTTLGSNLASPYTLIITNEGFYRLTP